MHGRATRGTILMLAATFLCTISILAATSCRKVDTKTSDDDLQFVDDYLKRWDRFARGENELVPFINLYSGNRGRGRFQLPVIRKQNGPPFGWPIFVYGADGDGVSQQHPKAKPERCRTRGLRSATPVLMRLTHFTCHRGMIRF